jgi:hypothetical protein
MTMASLGVNPSQRWTIVRGVIPGCPPGTIVELSTIGHQLNVSRPWFGVVAQLDLRIATITASSDGREIVLGTAMGEVAFEYVDQVAASPPAGASSLATIDLSVMVGQVVQFGGRVAHADGSTVFNFLVLRRVSGWVLGLTEAGRPSGIAEANIAWARVRDPGPQVAPDRLVITYTGNRQASQRAFEAELPTLRELGYEQVAQMFTPTRGKVLNLTMPSGILTVTVRRAGTS